jgi:hypothetical protein
MVSQIPAIRRNWQIGEWSRLRVGSQIDRKGWVPTAFLVVVNGGWAVGLIDFTVGAMLLRGRMPHPNSVGGSAI